MPVWEKEQEAIKVIPLTTSQLWGALQGELGSYKLEKDSVDTSTAKTTRYLYWVQPRDLHQSDKVADIKETKTAPVPVYNYVTTNGNDWDTVP